MFVRRERERERKRERERERQREREQKGKPPSRKLHYVTLTGQQLSLILLGTFTVDSKHTHTEN